MKASLLLLIFIPILILIIINLVPLAGRVRFSFARTCQVMGVYLILLLASLTAFYTMAESRQKDPVPVPEKELEEPDWDEYERIIRDYYNAIIGGYGEEYEGAELVKKWDFDYPGKRLLLKTADGRQYYDPIAIEEKAADDEKIEARYYTISKNDQDFLPVIPPEVRLAGEVLEIVLPEWKEIKAICFVQDFTSAQFTGKGLESTRNNSYPYYPSHPVLYLQVPRDLQIVINESIVPGVTFIEK